MTQSHSINALLDTYAHHARASGLSEHTISRVRINVRCFTRDMDITSAHQITTELVFDWGSQLREEGKSQSAVYAYFNSIRSFLTFLEASNVSHSADRKLIHARPNYKRMVVLRANDVALIAHHAHSDQIRVLIKLLYCTMMRLGEALTVKPGDVNDDGTIYVNGKWCKNRYVVVWPELTEELKRLAPDGGYCFTTKNDGRPISRKTAYVFIKKAMIRAGYPDAYPHSLRHTGATEQLRNGASTSHVQRQLGHTNITTTQRYLHLITDDIIDSHTRFLPHL